MIKEFKASSLSVTFRLYAEAACSSTNITPVLEAYVLVCASCEITIKSGSETSDQHLWTGQDIV